MPEAMTVEQRLEALEKEVAGLRQRLEQLSEPKKNWLEEMDRHKPNLPESVIREFREIVAAIKQEGRIPNEE